MLEDESETVGEVVLQVIGFLLIAGTIIGAAFVALVTSVSLLGKSLACGAAVLASGGGVWLIRLAFVRRGKRLGHE